MVSAATIYLIVIIGFFALVILRTVLAAAGFRVPTTVDTWKNYVRGPGMFQLVFLILGAVVVVPAHYYSRARNPPPVNQVREFRIDPTKQTVFEADIQAYSRLTLFAHVEGGEKSAARLTILRRTGQSDGEITRIENVTTSTWSRLDLENLYSKMILIVEPSSQADATPAKQVDVVLHLKTK
jgi:hypothetical protein